MSSYVGGPYDRPGGAGYDVDWCDCGAGDGFDKLHVTATVKSNDHAASPYCSVKALNKGSAEVGVGDEVFSTKQFKVGQTWQLVSDETFVPDGDVAKVDRIKVNCLDI